MFSSIAVPAHSIHAVLVCSLQFLEFMIEFYSKTCALSKEFFMLMGRTVKSLIYENQYSQKTDKMQLALSLDRQLSGCPVLNEWKKQLMVIVIIK